MSSTNNATSGVFLACDQCGTGYTIHIRSTWKATIVTTLFFSRDQGHTQGRASRGTGPPISVGAQNSSGPGAATGRERVLPDPCCRGGTESAPPKDIKFLFFRMSLLGTWEFPYQIRSMVQLASILNPIVAICLGWRCQKLHSGQLWNRKSFSSPPTVHWQGGGICPKS